MSDKMYNIKTDTLEMIATLDNDEKIITRDGDGSITDFTPTSNYILLKDIFIMQAVRMEQGTTTVPIPYSETPGGANTILLNVKKVDIIHDIPEKVSTALRAHKAGIEMPNSSQTSRQLYTGR
jgi:hypothetical protein